MGAGMGVDGWSGAETSHNTLVSGSWVTLCVLSTHAARAGWAGTIPLRLGHWLLRCAQFLVTHKRLLVAGVVF